MKTNTKVFKEMQRALEAGYTVTESGIVLNPSGKPRSLTLNGKYLKFNMPGASIRVHSLQALQKYGTEAWKNAECVRHLDGNSLNNSRNNIALGTHSENTKDIPARKRKELLKETRRFRKGKITPKYKWFLAHYYKSKKHTMVEVAKKSGIAYSTVIEHFSRLRKREQHNG